MSCEISDLCGGCTLRNLSEDEYRLKKYDNFKKIISQIGVPDIKMNPPIYVADGRRRRATFAFEYKKKQERNKELAAALLQKENALEELKLRCEALEKNYNNLKQAKILSLNDNAVNETREKISKLVREIDRCIESLKK
jgi:tRNA/tmRNA/rRNA uracil-C5-methylase (TrmA/RlmC/RlmD family)